MRSSSLGRKRAPNLQWDAREFEHMPLDVSATRPVEGWLNVYPRRQSLPYDMHYALEFGLVLRGRVRRDYRGLQRTLGPGGVWYCGPWEPHGGIVVEAPCELLVFVCWPSALAEMRYSEAPDVDLTRPFVAPAAQREQPTPDQQRALRSWAQRTVPALRDQTPHGRLRNRLALVEGLLLAWHAGPGGRSETGVGLEQAGRLERSIALVNAGRRPVAVQEAARLCAMSRSRFERRFQRLMGLSFAQFELRHRVHGAAGDLLRTDQPLKAIAAAWGFADASHLHRRFVEIYGHSPGQHRALGRGADKSQLNCQEPP